VLIVLGIAAGGAVGLAARMKKARAEEMRAGQWLLQWRKRGKRLKERTSTHHHTLT
jgi:hypothetical protein